MAGKAQCSGATLLEVGTPSPAGRPYRFPPRVTSPLEPTGIELENARSLTVELCFDERLLGSA